MESAYFCQVNNRGVKFNHPKVAEKVKAVAYQECGLEPPKANGANAFMLRLLKKV